MISGNLTHKAVVALTIACVVFTATAQAAPARRVVLISIDGLTAADSVRLGRLDTATPTLEALVASGVRAQGVVPTTPANTFPNHATMVTGVSAAKHGIFDNDIFAPGTDRHGLFYHYASDLKSKTIFEAAAEADRKTMAIWWPLTTGADIDYLLADVPGDVRERGKYVYASASPEIREVLRSPENAGQMTDALRLEAALAGLAGRPDFMAIHFTELDSAQHEYGVGSPEAMAALQETDHRISEFLGALDTAGMRRETAIIIASDHGFSSLHSAVYPGTLFRAYGLLELDDTGAVREWTAYPWPGGGALAIYINPQAEDRSAAINLVDHLITLMRNHPADFVKSVYKGEAMGRFGGYPDAYALVNAKSGFAFGGDLDSVLVRSGTRTRAVHGFVADDAAMHGSLILSGAGVNANSRLGIVNMEDIAPTVAYLLGLSLPGTEGRVLTESLQKPERRD